jgi:hypothetical protein
VHLATRERVYSKKIKKKKRRREGGGATLSSATQPGWSFALAFNSGLTEFIFLFILIFSTEKVMAALCYSFHFFRSCRIEGEMERKMNKSGEKS